MFLFVLFIAGVVTLFDYLYQGGYVFTFYALLFSIPTALFSYYKGDWLALKTAGAIPITKEDNPYVVRMVENLTITAGMPMPKVHIIPDRAMNAFATGRDPQHASIAITQGLIDQLENEELEGVIAHELSHVKNYDIRLMTVVIICVGFIAVLADLFLRSHWFGFGGRRSNDREGGRGLEAILMIVGLALAILAPLFAQLIQFAVSRKREFLADASGALLTRYPEGLARALEKISASAQPVARATKATAHLYISNPFGGGRRLARLFSTHPPIEQRITALREMSKAA